MHYYQHNIKDFNNATRHLTRVERCSYRDAIELYYDTEKPLISDLNQLARKLLCLTNDEKDALKYVLDEFFYLVDGFYHHTRCDFEIDKFHNTASAKARAGKASADSRRKKKESKIEQKATGVEQVLNSVKPVFEHNSTNQQPTTINHKPITKIKDLSSNDDDIKFLTAITNHWNEIMTTQPRINLLDKTKATQTRIKSVKKILKDYPNYSDAEYFQGYFYRLATLKDFEWQRENKQVTFDQATNLTKFARNIEMMRMEETA